MSDYIKASFDTLLEQASDAARTYLSNAKRAINEEFGEGFAENNPQLVGEFIRAAASDLNAATNAKVIGAALQEISASLESMAKAIKKK